jgi:hypothetical protein
MLVTLLDAGEYITTLPKAEQQLDEWQTAIEVLLLVSRGGPTMMARIRGHEGAQSRRSINS